VLAEPWRIYSAEEGGQEVEAGAVCTLFSIASLKRKSFGIASCLLYNYTIKSGQSRFFFKMTRDIYTAHRVSTLADWGSFRCDPLLKTYESLR
jgi:hypothetical protein